MISRWVTIEINGTINLVWWYGAHGLTTWCGLVVGILELWSRLLVNFNPYTQFKACDHVSKEDWIWNPTPDTRQYTAFMPCPIVPQCDTVLQMHTWWTYKRWEQQGSSVVPWPFRQPNIATVVVMSVHLGLLGRNHNFVTGEENFINFREFVCIIFASLTYCRRKILVVNHEESNILVSLCAFKWHIQIQN